MEAVSKVTLDAEEADNEQAASTQCGGARHVTILMAVGFLTDLISPTLIDGATADAVAVDDVLTMDVEQDPDTGDTMSSGDTTDVTDTAESAVAADILEVDFGWGIVVGGLSLEDSKQIASFPELLATD